MKHKINSDLSILSYILIRVLILFIIIILLFPINELKEITIVQLVKGVGASVAIWLLYLRFKTTDNIRKNQEEQFRLTNQHKNFLETSKMLTDKNSTIEAKVSAMYLLYDYAKHHPDEVEKVYQLLSEYIKPLLNCIDNNCNNTKYRKIKDSLEVEKVSKKTIFTFKEKKVLNIDIEKCIKEKNLIKTITSWQISGTDTEKLVASALIIIRDLTSNILPKLDKPIDLSNIIIFNLDIDFTENNIKIPSNHKPIYNLIFLRCNLKKLNLEKTKIFYSKFLYCDLDEVNFNDAQLKGTKFINSDLKDTKFVNVPLNTIIFQDCYNAPK